jgi:TatD DNase family protein
MYIDFHTHKPIAESDPEVIEIISAHVEVKYSSNYFTIGHHPWWSLEQLTQSEISDVEVKLQDAKCLGIGECGLDKLKGASKDIQEEVFLQQIEIANRYNAPLIMHCVRKYDRAIQLKKAHGNSEWCIHGFRRNAILAKDILDAGMYVSISPIKFMPDSFINMIKYLPLDRFFIETDSEYSLSIIERYEIVAQLKNINLSVLQNQMINNFESLFKWKEIKISTMDSKSS